MRPSDKPNRRPLSSPRRLALLAAAICLWISTLSVILNHEIAVEWLPATAPRVAPDGVVYQSTDYSCGPASLATLFGHYNIVKSEREWAEVAGTNLSVGTRLSGLKNAAESMGFEPVALNPTFDQLDLICWPSILFQSKDYHLVTFWGKDREGCAIIRDPALGRTRWGPAEYAAFTPSRPDLLVFYPGRVPTCGPDSSSMEIGRIQNMLSALGYYKGKVDCAWTDRLATAVASFQSDMHLDPTGIVDAPTDIYLEGAWRLVTNGPIEPFMRIDCTNEPTHRPVAILTRLSPSD